AAVADVVTRHCQTAIFGTLAKLPPPHNDRPHTPLATRRRCIGTWGHGGQNTSERSDGPDPRSHRWCASVHRGTNEDGAGRRVVARAEGGIRAGRPSTAISDSDDVAGIVDGASGSVVSGAGGGPDRRRGGSRVSLRTSEHRCWAAEAEIGRVARPIGALRIDLLPGRNSACDLHLQTCTSAGRRICRALEKPSRPYARRHPQ